jgi:hypothetical protein
MTLAEILVDVFHRAKRRARFHIDVSVKCEAEGGVMWDNRRVIEHSSIAKNESSVVWTRVQREAIFSMRRCCTQRSWIPLRTRGHSVLHHHAGSVWIRWPTGTMEHVPRDRREEFGLKDRVWEMCRDDPVDVVLILKLILRMENEQDMRMREASLLKLNHGEMSHDSAKSRISEKHVHQLLQLQLEDTADNVRAVLRRPVGCATVFNNLVPLRVASERDEQIWFPERADDTHCILVRLLHVAYP